MIEFNTILQNLGHSLHSKQKLKKLFAAVSLKDMITLISSLDPHGKGYLTYSQLSKNSSEHLLTFLKTTFQCKISYSMLAAYLQKLDNTSSSLLIGQTQQVGSHKIIELLEAQCGCSRYKQTILLNIAKYILGSKGKITGEQFESYCHSQKLAIDPAIVFDCLSGKENQILVNQGTSSLGDTKDAKQQYNATLNAIAKLNTRLERLGERANKFGAEWL